MKQKLLFLLFMLCSIATNYAQTSATQAGIAVQGIARDANNTAMASKSISLTFTLYYLNSSSQEVEIYKKDENLTTDTFGVFSYVIDPTAANNSKIANNVAYLRIKNGQIIISDEKLRHVPYAISASNGVPTGSIMPYIGTTAPQGWVLCNGQLLTGIPGAADLIVLLGNNAPDLRGMFLRGAGTNTITTPVNYTGNTGPNLMTIQSDALESHNHNQGSLVTSTAGNHNHKNGSYDSLMLINGQGTATNTDNSAGLSPNLETSGVMSDNGNHTHTITGATGSTGSTETRPVNYGVNYIIKL